MYVYHVVTDRPMYVGQQIVFDEQHHSGVYYRVYEKLGIVKDIYNNPSKYNTKALDHHTAVALRELALEEIRLKKYPAYPSRMSCLYVSETFEEAKNGANSLSKSAALLIILSNWKSTATTLSAMPPDVFVESRTSRKTCVLQNSIGQILPVIRTKSLYMKSWLTAA